MTARLLIVALDGADGRLLDHCSAQGLLPNIAALRARGRTQSLSAPPGITDDALWASFQYAIEVGEHGRYHYQIPLRGGHFGMAHLQDVGRESFWQGLSNRGLRVAVIDIPKCGAPRPVNGLHLVDWLVHGRYYRKPRSQPPTLAKEVLEQFGPAPPSRCDQEQSTLTDDDVREITHNLRASVEKKRLAGLHYLAAEAWDLYLIGFKEAHCSSHAFWDLVDASHPAHDPVRCSRLGEPVMTILDDIDRAIGDLVAAAGPLAEVVVFTTTDFEPNGSLNHLMPEIVERLNTYLSVSRSGPVEQVPNRQGSRQLPSFVDWRCAILPYNENCAALRIMCGSQTEFESLNPAPPPDPSLLDAIEAQLRDLRDAETGRRVVSSFTRPSSELKGSRAATLPDLLIHCASGVFPRAVVTQSLGRIEAKSPMMRPGNHAAGGFLISAGRISTAASADVRTIAGIGPLAERVLCSPR